VKSNGLEYRSAAGWRQVEHERLVEGWVESFLLDLRLFLPDALAVVEQQHLHVRVCPHHAFISIYPIHRGPKTRHPIYFLNRPNSVKNEPLLIILGTCIRNPEKFQATSDGYTFVYLACQM